MSCQAWRSAFVRVRHSIIMLLKLARWVSWLFVATPVGAWNARTRLSLHLVANIKVFPSVPRADMLESGPVIFISVKVYTGN